MAQQATGGSSHHPEIDWDAEREPVEGVIGPFIGDCGKARAQAPAPSAVNA